MAQALRQQHRGSQRPQYLFMVPHLTERTTVSGRKIVEPDVDWFVHEACGKDDFDGLTVRERRERTAKRWRVVKQGAVVLLVIALAVLVKVL